MDQLKSIGIVVNATKEGARELAMKLAEIARQAGVEARLCEAYPVPLDFLKGCDFCCTVGGDGTLLSVVPAAIHADVPVMGINFGKLGFMASFASENAVEALQQAIGGRYLTSERTLLSCACSAGSAYLALNDIVVKTRSSRLLRLRVYADDHFVNEYYADGLIISTPTGSTAYNLSADGPLIHPSAPVLAMTPICPHTLSNRSVIFSDDTRLRIALCGSEADVHATLDGRPCFQSWQNFPLTLQKAERTFHLVQNPGEDHFSIVRKKLHWGENGR